MPKFLEFTQKTEKKKQFSHLKMTSTFKKIKKKSAGVTKPKAS